MGMGFIKVAVEGGGTIRSEMRITVRDIRGNVLGEGLTNGNGITEAVAVDAPDAAHTLYADDPGPCFTLVDVEVSGVSTDALKLAYIADSKDSEAYGSPSGNTSAFVRNVPVFDGIASVLPIVFREKAVLPHETALSPVFGLQMPHEQPGCMGQQNGRISRITNHDSSLPESIVVHLGRPAAEAPDILVNFSDYIKTAASCELYPTWPEAALEANIHCILSVVRHRLQSGYYRRQGYPFDITASVSFDPYYAPGWPVFENIAAITEHVLHTRVTRHGNPLPTPYCNGSTHACPGFSQWGSVALALQNIEAVGLLRHYFGTDVQISSCPTPKTTPMYKRPYSHPNLRPYHRMPIAFVNPPAVYENSNSSLYTPQINHKKTAPYGAVLRYMLLQYSGLNIL